MENAKRERLYVTIMLGVSLPWFVLVAWWLRGLPHFLFGMDEVPSVILTESIAALFWAICYTVFRWSESTGRRRKVFLWTVGLLALGLVSIVIDIITGLFGWGLALFLTPESMEHPSSAFLVSTVFLIWLGRIASYSLAEILAGKKFGEHNCSRRKELFKHGVTAVVMIIMITASAANVWLLAPATGLCSWSISGFVPSFILGLSCLIWAEWRVDDGVYKLLDKIEEGFY